MAEAHEFTVKVEAESYVSRDQAKSYLWTLITGGEDYGQEAWTEIVEVDDDDERAGDPPPTVSVDDAAGNSATDNGVTWTLKVSQNKRDPGHVVWSAVHGSVQGDDVEDLCAVMGAMGREDLAAELRQGADELRKGNMSDLVLEYIEQDNLEREITVERES